MLPGKNFLKGGQSGKYTTTSTNDDWGILSAQATKGESWMRGNPAMIASSYESVAEVDTEWGIVTETVTDGKNFSKGGQSGKYTTTSTNDDWGILKAQNTKGESWMRGNSDNISPRQ